MKIAFALLSGLALTACVSSGGPRQAVTEVTFSSQSPNALFGYDETLVQVVAPRDMSKVISIIEPQSGVPCQLRGANFTASFRTPGKVLLPDYGNLSKPVTVSCTYQGIARSVTANAFDATAEQAGREMAGENPGLGGMVFGALEQRRVAKDRRGQNDWKYPTITVNYQSMETR
jgi:hypothetical protein